MCAMQQRDGQVQQPQPPRPQPRYRFRWEVFVGIPVLAFVFLWLRSGIFPSFRFGDLGETFGVTDEEGYARLACLAVVLAATILIIKAVIRNDRSK